MLDLPAFRYLRPTSLAAALTVLARPGARAYAGGTDLLPALAARGAWVRGVRTIVDVKALAEARGVARRRGGLRIGALTTAHALATDPHVVRLVPVLAEAARATGAPALRRRGTLGGNLVTPHPAGDVTTALLALDAVVEVADRNGVDTVALADFLAAEQDAPSRQRLVLAVRVRVAPRSAYERLAARAGFGRACVAVAVAAVGRRTRVAVAGLAPRPMRAPATAAARGPASTLALAEDFPDVDGDPAASNGARGDRLRVAAVLLARARARAGLG